MVSRDEWDMKNYIVGIIGCGNIFPMHAVSIREIDNAELVAVCDIKEDRAKSEVKRWVQILY